MATLLSLPLELRLQILHDVLHNAIFDTPDSIDVETVRAQSKKLDKNQTSAWETGNEFLYPKTNQLTTNSILCVKQQLRMEATDFLERQLGVEGCILDVDFVSETIFIPTWRKLRKPSNSNKMDCLKCTIRVSGDPIEPRPTDYRGFSLGNSTVAAVAWSFYELLDRFLKYGPRWEPGRSTPEEGFGIETLIIDVKTLLDKETLARLPLTTRRRMRRYKPLPGQEEALYVECLVGRLKRSLSRLLQMEDHNPEYGDILYANLNKIVLRWDGKHEHTFDVASDLVCLMPAYEETLNSHREREWRSGRGKPLCVAKRARLGLIKHYEKLKSDFDVEKDKIGEMTCMTYSACLRDCWEDFPIFREEQERKELKEKEEREKREEGKTGDEDEVEKTRDLNEGAASPRLNNRDALT